MTGYDDLASLRAAADQAAATVAQLTKRLDAARAELATLPRTDRRWIVVNRAVNQLTLQVAQATSVAVAARAGYETALAEVPGQLDPTVPCLLLPVRLETRIRPRTDGVAGDELVCRIYPDDIHLDGHEPTLTEDEISWGTHYWRQFCDAEGADDAEARRRVAWTQLAGRVTPTRAAWVARQLTPTNLPPTAGVEPVFPAPATRGASYPSTVARALPDRWVVRLWRDGGLLGEGRGELIPRPLAIGPVTAPDEPAGPALWTTDLPAALANGMAVLVRPDPPAALDRVDVVTAVGVRADAAADGAATMRDLLDAHQFGPRLSWPGLDLVPPGTPTNNTPAARTPYRTDPVGDRAAARQLGVRTADMGDGSDADILAGALGLPDRDPDPAGPAEGFVFGRLDNGAGAGQRDAAAMATALWPATLGYYLRQFVPSVAGLASDTDLSGWRSFVVETVRGGGPLPAIRVGDQPYGVLPALPVAAWQHWPDRPEMFVAELHSHRSAVGVLRVSWDLDGAGVPGSLKDNPDDIVIDPHAARLELAAGYLGAMPILIAMTASAAGDIEYRLGRLTHAGDVQWWTDPWQVQPGGGAALTSPHVGVAVADMDGGPALVVAAEVQRPIVLGPRPVAAAASTGARPEAPAGARLAVGPEPPTVLMTLPQLQPPARNVTVTVLTVGSGLGTAGTVKAWSAEVEVPDSDGGAELASVATGDVTGNGGTDVVLAYIRRGATSDEVTYRVGTGLAETGAVSHWESPRPVSLPGGWRVTTASITLARLGGRSGVDLLVHVLGGPPGQAAGYYAVGHDLSAAGAVSGWSGWYTADARPDPGVLGTSVATLPLDRARQVSLASQSGLVALLERARASWEAAVPNVPRVGRTADPTDDLLDLFAADAVSTSVWGRGLLGPVLLANMWLAAGFSIDTSQYLRSLWQATSALPQAWGLLDPAAPDAADPAGKPRLGTGAFETVATELAGGLVGVAAALAELAGAPPSALDKWQPAADSGLLERLAHHAVRQAWADAGLALRPPGVPPEWAPYIEPELVDLNQVAAADTSAHPYTWTAWRHLRVQTFPAGHPWQGMRVEDGVAQALAVAEQNGDLSPYGPAAQALRELAEVRAALRYLAARPPEALAWTLGETLDVASYRADAWVTALATRRLRELRADQPSGLHLGGYGVVLDLRRHSGPASEGYVHAPSAGQAATAAVLHSAHLSHAGDADPAHPEAARFALDLTSRRVRDALDLANGVRAGQPLGALLGYRFERALLADPAWGLGQYLPALRQVAPLTSGRLTEPPAGVSVDAVAAVDVVDGLALVRATEPDAANPIPWGTTPSGADRALPSLASADGGHIAAAIASLRDAVDALGDLLLAESVHQAVNGNPTASGGALDVLAGAEVPPPEPAVARTPRAGIGITHRLLVALPEPGTVAATAAWAADRPRALAQPQLNAWAALALPAPTLIRWRAAWDDETGTEQATAAYDLAAVGLCPLDLVYLDGGPVVGDTGTSREDARSDLARILACHAAAAAPVAAAGGTLRLDLDRADDWADDELSVPEAVEVAAALRTVIGQARPADAADVAGARGRRPDSDLDLSGVTTAAAAAVTALGTALGQLRAPFTLTDPAAMRTSLRDAYPATPPEQFDDVTNLLDLPSYLDIGAAVVATGLPAAAAAGELRTALLRLAGYGLPHAAPATPQGSAEAELMALAAQAHHVADGVATRLAAAAAAGTDPVAVLVAIFGTAFVVVPPVRLPVGGPGDTAGGELNAGFDPTADDVLAGWLEGVATVRAGAARLADLRLVAGAAGRGGATRLRVAQLPAGVGWLGLPSADGAAPPGGAVSMVFAGPAFDPTVPVSVLHVDEWVEVFPSVEQHTSVALHVDAPAACAPQTLLLAVAADPARRWTQDSLEQVVLDTVRLAQERAVDLDVSGAPGAGHFLPSLLFASNDEGATVSSTFPRVP